MQINRGPGAAGTASDAGIGGVEQLNDTTVTLAPPARSNRLRLLEWRAKQQNTLRGFCTVELPSGLIICDIAINQKGGRSWICLPGRPVLDAGGRHLTNHAGDKRYAAMLGWRDRALADRFSTAVIEVVRAAYPEALDAVSLDAGAINGGSWR